MVKLWCIQSWGLFLNKKGLLTDTLQPLRWITKASCWVEKISKEVYFITCFRSHNICEMIMIIEMESRLVVAKEWWGWGWLKRGRGEDFVVRAVLHPEAYKLWANMFPGFEIILQLCKVQPMGETGETNQQVTCNDTKCKYKWAYI